MSAKLNTIKGFADHLPEEARVFTHMSALAAKVFAAYGYKEVHIPILEYTELFARSIGTETDVVQKEMFTFPDRKGRSLTMRPEATAGIMRAYIEHSLYAQGGVSKLFTHGPMFRYERPQKGRMRQFHQLNCECLGAEEPQNDAEVVLMLMDFLQRLGLDKLTLELNTLGCKECRPKYKEQLQNYLKAKDISKFCSDCQRRIETNPMRVLDCKVEACRELSKDAPAITDNVCPDCSAHFEVVKQILERAKLPYVLNKRLVRGLDYYTRTTFEVVSGAIGAQSSVAGGGRYDGLVSSLGGPEVPGIGFACGMERLALLAKELEADNPDFYIATLTEKACSEAVLLAQQLRAYGLRGESSFKSGSMKSQMRQAAKSQAAYCLIIGQDELDKQQLIAKNMLSGEQQNFDMAAPESLYKHITK